MLTQTEKPKVRNTLTKFARKYCANFDRDENLCLLCGTCRLAMGKPCNYFKKAVFPICDPGYKFATETKLYSKLFKLYSGLDHNLQVKDAIVKMCPDCNLVELLPRQRVCPKCKDKRATAARRQWRNENR